ncbi:MAG: hypothetical protein ACETVS_01410 [Dehalococcoidales bacterium]
MSKPEREGKQTPEWNIFDRLDELEDITLKLMEKVDEAEPMLKNVASMLKDALIMGQVGIYFNFVSVARLVRRDYRKGRDIFIRNLKSQGLSKERLEEVEHTLTQFCERIEKKRVE